MNYDAHRKRRLCLFLLIFGITALLPSCSGSIPFASKEPVDLSGYDSMSGYDKESRFYETSVPEIDELMQSGASFVFLATFEDCPYCSVLMPYLNDALIEKDMCAGYLDTRKDPDWHSNTDIDGYDRFAELFGEYLSEDEDGRPHLYTPHLFVIKDGKVVSEHQGVLSNYDADQPLTAEQESELRSILSGMLSSI